MNYRYGVIEVGQRWFQFYTQAFQTYIRRKNLADTALSSTSSSKDMHVITVIDLKYTAMEKYL